MGINKISEIIKEKDPAIIGFSVTTYGLSTAIDIAKKIREKFPTKLTLCGGAHARDAPEQTNYDFFDIVTYGKDGEIIISADANLWREDLRIYEISDIVLGISEA